MTTNQRSREAAYADLVSGLIDARIDVASDRFDAELEAAESSGRLDPATARLLRWWQRESVRAVTEHARTTVPATLVALEKAEKEAREAVYRADAAWTSARSVTARSTYAAEAPTTRQPVAAEPLASEPVAPEPAPTQSAEPATPAAPPAPVPDQPEPAAPPAPAPWSATVTPPNPAPSPPPEPTSPWGTTLEPPNYPGEAEPPPPPPAAPRASYPTTPGEAPSIVDLTAHEASQDPTATPAPGRRRTLLAGLTVLPRTD